MGACGSDMSKVTNPGDPQDKPTPGIEVKKEIQDISSFIKAVPNPFYPKTVLAFNLTDRLAHAPAQITIYTLQGKAIRTIQVPYTSGTFARVTWNGTDDLGRLVGAGIYIAELFFGTKILSEKLIFTR
jgi:hypothetical protein